MLSLSSRYISLMLFAILWSGGWTFAGSRTGGRAGGRLFRDSAEQQSFPSVAAEMAGRFAFGACVAGGSAVLATVSYCSWIQAPTHSWIVPMMCFAGASCASVPGGIVASLVRARTILIDTGAVRDATSRAWSAVVPETSDAALATSIESALNASSVASALVNDFVKGAGLIGTPARLLAVIAFPALDAALIRIEATISEQYKRRRWNTGGEMRRRVEPVLASAAEGVVVRLIDEKAALVAFVAFLLALCSDGVLLFLDVLLPR